MKLFKSTQASISLIVAFFLALLLITTITVSFLLILENHNQSTTTGVEYQKQTLKGVREQLQATLIDANNSQITITIQNIGQTPTQITQLLVTNNDNSLNPIAINPPINLLPLEKQTITIPCTQQYQNLGILTKNGNIYPMT